MFYYLYQDPRQTNSIGEKIRERIKKFKKKDVGMFCNFIISYSKLNVIISLETIVHENKGITVHNCG